MELQNTSKLSLVEAFAKAMQGPTDDEVYETAMQATLWSIDEASALIAGLTPENYKNGTKGSMNCSDEVFRKRESYATSLFSRILDDLEKTTIKDFIASEDRLLWSPWRYIKWIAENGLNPNERFFGSLSLSLMELYYEFQPVNATLRTASKRSRAYHQALYIQHAQKLLDEFPGLIPSQIYKHKRMENIQRYIRELGGKYTKRTILESWLPKLIKLTRGRPKKSKKAHVKNTVSS